LTTDMTGSGTLDLAKLVVESATTETTGSGKTIVNASGSLMSSIMGSGDVDAVGTGKIASKVTGSGKVNNLRPN
jgi:hypothetical protein